MVQFASTLPDFTTSTLLMITLISGADDILPDSGQTIGTTSSLTISTPSPMYTLATVNYILSTSSTSDVIYQTDNQSPSVLENLSTQVIPDLTCSISGSTSITFSLSNYISSSVPVWITINSSTGALQVNAPEVSSDSEYKFYIVSTVSGMPTSSQKLIKLTVMNWNALNCQKCVSTSNSIWSVWISGFELQSGSWKVQIENSSIVSETSQALSTTTTSAVTATVGFSIMSSFMNTASISSLWMTINQLQFFFLFLLTRADIPKDVEAIIIGSDFASNIYEYIPIRKLKLYPNILHKYEFDVEDQRLDLIGVKYSSTIANTSTSFIWLIFILFFYGWIWLLRLILKKLWEPELWTWFIKATIWVLDQIYKIMTFGLFIRNALEMSQFVLIWSIYEIFEFNVSESFRLQSFLFALLMILLFIFIILPIAKHQVNTLFYL